MYINLSSMVLEHDYSAYGNEQKCLYFILSSYRIIEVNPNLIKLYR